MCSQNIMAQSWHSFSKMEDLGRNNHTKTKTKIQKGKHQMLDLGLIMKSAGIQRPCPGLSFQLTEIAFWEGTTPCYNSLGLSHSPAISKNPRVSMAIKALSS